MVMTMKEIEFDNELAREVIAGEKTVTVVEGKRDYEVRDQLIAYNEEEDPFAILRVDGVADMPASKAYAATRVFRAKHGIEGPNDMVEKLKVKYPGIKEDDRITVVSFEVDEVV